MDGRVSIFPCLRAPPMVYGFILPFRPKRSAAAYRQIWTAQGSPLIAICTEVARKLRRCLRISGRAMYAVRQPVDRERRWHVRTGSDAEWKNPGLSDVSALRDVELRSAVARIREVAAQHGSLRCGWPLFALTTITTAILMHLPLPPHPYLTQGYDHLLFSFHGMPVRHLAKADCET